MVAASVFTARAAEETTCAICWDGTIAKYEDGMCLCPAVNTDVPTVVDDSSTDPIEPTEASDTFNPNPNCTMENKNAC